MTEVEAKLSKKQKKALGFRKSKEERQLEKEQKKRQREEETTDDKDTKKDNQQPPQSTTTPTPTDADTQQPQPPAKKRKTRRGKKGKGVNGGHGPRFILFVGNLPYDTTQTELTSHFKNCSPDRIRIRQDKGIAFLEFDNDTKEIQSKMELALRMHHSMLRNRKINVELTVGGGGNSENRVQKIKEKNEKMLEGRKKMDEAKKSKKGGDKKGDGEGSGGVPAGVHPSRMRLIG